MSTQPEALRLADELPRYRTVDCCNAAADELRRLHALTEQENVAADAYNHACDEMERWQHERRKAGKEVGTTGSLCDGIAWLYQHIADLEAKQGTPATGGEPVAWYEYNADLDAWFLAYSHNPKAKTRPLVLGDTSPQPVREPLTDEQIGALACRDGLANVEVPVIQWLVREVEFLHGITGGQT